MQPVKLTIWNCHQLRRVRAIEFTATIDFKGMSTRGRNSLLKMIEGAWVTSSAHTGVGLLAFKLLASADVWFLSGKIRGWKSQYWGHNMKPPPPGFEEGMDALAQADKVAHNVAGERGLYNNPYRGHQIFHKLRPQDHIHELLADYVASEEYKVAVAPIVRAIKEGRTLQVDIKKPNSRHWRG